MRLAGAALIGLCAAVALLAMSASSSGDAGVEPLALPAPARPAFVIPEPKLLSSPRALARWTTVIRAGPVRAHPDRGARIVASLETRTPEGTSNVVSVVGAAHDASGEAWVAVRVPALPTNVIGWTPRRVLGGYAFVHTRLVVDLERRSAELQVGGRSIFSAPIGIGTPSSPTPTGEYYVRSRVQSLRSPAYGPLAFGTSARSPVLTDWPGGGFVGIHGTNQPELIPGAISHGCIRLRNEDILELGRLMPVGTLVTIR